MAKRLAYMKKTSTIVIVISLIENLLPKKIAYLYENCFADDHAAVEWLKKAVTLGDKNFRFQIVEIYRDSRALEPSGFAAIAWFIKILNDKTLPDHERYAAAFEIGKMFYEGRAVPYSDTAAIKYFTLSAKAGVVTARAAYVALADKSNRSRE